MRILSAVWAFVGRWYVSAVLATAIGLAAGYVLFFNVFPGKPQIGVIDIPYTFIDEDSAYVIGQMLDYASRDDSIKAVVIKLVTPGGDAAPAEELYYKIAGLRKSKPVVVASGWLSASGGVMLSMGANYVYATPSSFVGSIGVSLSLPAEQRTYEERRVSSGPAKLAGGSQLEFTRMLEQRKETFIRMVVSERGDRLKMTPAQLAEARLYMGLEAMHLGLVDDIGTDTDAIEKAASLAGVSGYGLVDINEMVLRQFVEKQRRVFGEPEATEDGQLPWPDIARLRRMDALSGQGDRSGGPPQFPIEVDPPRLHYLYVAPSD